MTNPILEVQKYGQSIWYDNIRRGLITSGELYGMVERDGLLGVTSNPAIFTAAITGSPDYDQAIKGLVGQGVGTAVQLYEKLAIQDIQLAADILYPVYHRTKRIDGYVSMEVSPYLANDTKGTIAEARRLHADLRRDNVLIKVPATPAGIPAIQTLIGEGISVNVTLLFSVEAYEKVAEAYISGLEQYAANGGDVSKVASVASFFVSRIDSLVDEKIAGPGQLLDKTTDSAKRDLLKKLVGKVAIANAKVAYARYRDICATPRWQALLGKGAMPQRLLWASTSTKNPKYPKTMYVDELIGRETVNTVPGETYTAFKEGGKVRPSLTENWDENMQNARETMQALAEVGIDFKQVAQTVLDDAVKKFSDPFDKLLASVEKKRQAIQGGLAPQTVSAGALTAAVQKNLEDWRVGGKIRRLWDGDASLWTDRDESRWLGWLHVIDGQRDDVEHFKHLVEVAKSSGFQHALLLGMGGSSLAPEVFKKTFGKVAGFPELHVLDSTVPAQVKALEKKIDLRKTVFIVSSKSGGTIEPNAFRQYFRDKVQAVLGNEPAGSRFVAITDPNTKMNDLAKKEHFRHIFMGVPSLIGRFGALSNFGLIPLAIMGVDVVKFLDSTEVMVQACASCVPPELNPGVQLGVALGTLAKEGRDKVTLLASPGIAGLGAWLEQLLGESTGKCGKGLIPIDREKVGPPEVYGNDRVFVYERLEKGPDRAQDEAVAALEKAGHPIIRINVADALDMGQEMFRWEIAAAVAGSVLGINPFTQPDVEDAKVATRKLVTEYAEKGKLPGLAPLLSEGGLTLEADANNGGELTTANTKSADLFIAAYLSWLKPGDYFAVNAFVEMNDANDKELQALRHAVRDGKKTATTLGYGPRFLHSTGQLHKGGPNTGVFLQVTCDDAEDVPIPGEKFTFGVLKQAQAQGDFDVLAARGRRVLRVHVGKDVAAGLARLRELVQKAARG
jgi:transaldolase/glucose-6-phosphate isomerase